VPRANDRRISRWKAAGIHLLISVAIALGVAALMLLVWYPPPYFDAAGGSLLVLLLIGVDITIGPCLTLVVFDQAKRHLVLDLAVIAALQAGALAYGLSVMFEARPVYLVYAKSGFELVAANEIDANWQEQAAPAFRVPPRTGPEIIGVRYPTDPQTLERVLTRALLGHDITLDPRYYTPYADVARTAAMHGRPLSELRAGDRDATPAIDAAVRALGLPEDALVFLPVRARRNYVALLERSTGRVVRLVPAISRAV
jgi:hypothetical protein